VRAIILAAGRGLRLKQPTAQEQPKCLLEFGGRTLLERHLQLLQAAGITEIVLALGFLHEVVQSYLAGLTGLPRPQIVLNPQFELGSVLTLHTATAALTGGGDVLVMDADVLYHERIMAALVAKAGAANRLLIDRDF
jgi:choline kinase